MLRRLRILLVLFLLLLWIDRWNKRNQEQSGGMSGVDEQGEGGSIVLEKDAPIVLTEEAPLAKMEDTPAAVAESAGLDVVSPAGDQAPVAPEETGGLPGAEVPSEAGVFAEGSAPESAAPESEAAEPAVQEPAATEAAIEMGPGEGATETAEAERDDLTVIEGIGSRISELLHNAGIHTFKQLAQSEPERIKEILREAGLNMVDPATWKEQAELAAKDDWESLENLQGRLNAGRRG